MGGWALEVRRTEEADGRQRWRPTGDRWGGGGVGRCGEAFFFLLAFSLVRAEDERDEAGILEVGPGMRGEERGGGQGIKKECESAI